MFNLLWGGTMDKKLIDRVGSASREVVSKVIDLLIRPNNVSDYFPVLAKFDLQVVEKEAKSVAECCDEILDSLMNERAKTMVSGERRDEGRKDFLQILLELKEQDDPDKSINLSQIKAILKDVIVGGTDTMATIIEWVMAEVLNNPHVKKRVQEELTEVVGFENIVDESHIPKQHYLDAVVKETFRLHPPLLLLVPKHPSQCSIIGGYTIPKGSRVFLNMWSIHRDPLFWESPFEFKPDRFLNVPGKFDFNGNNFQYLPFGSGRRVCPVFSWLRGWQCIFWPPFSICFDWKLPEVEKIDLPEKFGIVTSKRTPLIAIPSPRLHDSNMYV